MTPESTTSVGVQRAIVVSVDGATYRVLPDGTGAALDARFIVTCGCHTAPRLAPGDAVLVVDAGSGSAVILGALHDGDNASSQVKPPGDAVPESIVLEAAEELTLRVGDGSITIRKDGKILIKGQDLVSHAKRVNRIKGGSVSIN